jgi:hypothetical protein
MHSQQNINKYTEKNCASRWSFTKNNGYIGPSFILGYEWDKIKNKNRLGCLVYAV